MADSGDNNVEPLEMLAEELRSDDVERRVHSMRQLTRFAEALGPRRTREELVPFLSEQIEDDDEVLLIMAEQLREFVPLVGGHIQAVCLMDLLGSLAAVEETVVRDQAVDSINTIVSGLTSGQVEEFVIPVIEQLAQGDWFTSRVSACGLFATAYSRLDDDAPKTKLRTTFKTLCDDETPMVKRAAARHIGNFVQSVEQQYAISELLPLFEKLAEDEQDSVRLLTIENCTAFAKKLDDKRNKEIILPMVEECAKDRSWRVRNNVAKEFHPLAAAIGQSVDETLLPLFVQLLQDPEAEVRAGAVKNIAGFCDIIGAKTFLDYIMPTLNELVIDQAVHVQVNLAESLVEALPKLGEEGVSKSLLDKIVDFMGDPIPEVRLKVLSNLDKVVGTIGSKRTREVVLPKLMSLFEDQQWRIRQNIVQQVPLLAQHLGPQLFEQHLFPPFWDMFRDPFACVRIAATRSLAELGKQMGSDWCMRHLVPNLKKLYDSSTSYLGRITVLYATEHLCSTPQLTGVLNELLPLIIRGTSDSVPNVKFVSAKVIKSLCNVFAANDMSNEVQSPLSKLKNDTDKDVRFFADDALEQLQQATA